MNIYCGNLSYQMNDEELRNIFINHGVINSAKIIINKETGRSKGFGFVEIDNEDEAKRAIQELNGTTVKGRRIRVNEGKLRMKEHTAAELV
jgi:RNA recognition motif-containing protein